MTGELCANTRAQPSWYQEGVRQVLPPQAEMQLRQRIVPFRFFFEEFVQILAVALSINTEGAHIYESDVRIPVVAGGKGGEKRGKLSIKTGSSYSGSQRGGQVSPLPGRT